MGIFKKQRNKQRDMPLLSVYHLGLIKKAMHNLGSTRKTFNTVKLRRCWKSGNGQQGTVKEHRNRNSCWLPPQGKKSVMDSTVLPQNDT